MQHRRCHTSRAACEAAHAGRSEPRARSWEHSGGFWSDPGQGRSLALRGPNVHPPPTGPTARAYSPAPKPTRQTLAPGHHPGRATPVPPSLSVRSNICRRRPPAQFRPLPPEPAAAACLRPRGAEKKVGLTGCRPRTRRLQATAAQLCRACRQRASPWQARDSQRRHTGACSRRCQVELQPGSGNVGSRQAPERGRQGTPGMDRDTQKQPTRYSTWCRGGSYVCATATKWRRAPAPPAAGAQTGRPARREKKLAKKRPTATTSDPHSDLAAA